MISKKLEAVFSESQVMMLVEEFNSNLKLVFEGISTIDKKLDDKVADLKEDIAIVDCKVMGLSKRLDSVEERLSREITEVRNDLAAHRNNTELHHSQPKRPLKRA
jgi:hypothetical protein